MTGQITFFSIIIVITVESSMSMTFSNSVHCTVQQKYSGASGAANKSTDKSREASAMTHCSVLYLAQGLHRVYVNSSKNNSPAEQKPNLVLVNVATQSSIVLEWGGEEIFFNKEAIRIRQLKVDFMYIVLYIFTPPPPWF